MRDMEKIADFLEKVYLNYFSTKEKFSKAKGVSKIPLFFRLFFWFPIFLISFLYLFFWALIAYISEIENAEAARGYMNRGDAQKRETR